MSIYNVSMYNISYIERIIFIGLVQANINCSIHVMVVV